MAKNLFYECFDIVDPDSDSSAHECCYLGLTAAFEYERATELEGQPGSEHITEVVVDYLKDRRRIAQRCNTAVMAECALKAAGMLDIP
jgi:hypothetical protein